MVHKPMSGLQGLVEAALSAFASERLPDLERSGGGRDATAEPVEISAVAVAAEPDGHGGISR